MTTLFKKICKKGSAEYLLVVKTPLRQGQWTTKTGSYSRGQLRECLAWQTNPIETHAIKYGVVIRLRLIYFTLHSQNVLYFQSSLCVLYSTPQSNASINPIYSRVAWIKFITRGRKSYIWKKQTFFIMGLSINKL